MPNDYLLPPPDSVLVVLSRQELRDLEVLLKRRIKQGLLETGTMAPTAEARFDRLSALYLRLQSMATHLHRVTKYGDDAHEPKE